MPYIKLKKELILWDKYIPAKKDNLPTLVFVHGWVQNHTAWNKVVLPLRKLGYGILLIDLPGHGLSTTPRDIINFDIMRFAKICSNVVKRRKLKKVVLIGHSLGGMVVQYMCKQIKPAAIVLADTTYQNPLKDASIDISFQAPIISALLYALAQRAPQSKRSKLFDFSKHASQEEIALWLRGANTTNARALLACLHSIIQLNSEPILRKIECPTLLLVGSHDVRTPISRMRQMKKLISNSKLVIIKQSGHNTNISAPDEFAKNVHNFISSSLL